MTLWWKVPGAFSCSSRRSGWLSWASSMSWMRVVTPKMTPRTTVAPTVMTAQPKPPRPAAVEHPEEVHALALRREEPEGERGRRT